MTCPVHLTSQDTFTRMSHACLARAGCATAWWAIPDSSNMQVRGAPNRNTMLLLQLQGPHVDGGRGKKTRAMQGVKDIPLPVNAVGRHVRNILFKAFQRHGAGGVWKYDKQLGRVGIGLHEGRARGPVGPWACGPLARGRACRRHNPGVCQLTPSFLFYRISLASLSSIKASST